MNDSVCNEKSCDKDLSDLDERSFSIVEWNPATKSNELKGIFCSAYHLRDYLDEEVPM